MNSYLLRNNTLRRTAVALMMLVLLLLPLQVEAIGHESRLVLPATESEGSAVILGRIESPDMVLARTETGSAASSFARVESPDMLMARVAAEGAGVVTPPFVDTAVSGVNVWSIVVLLVLAIGLAGILVLWEGMFPIKERDVERITNRCTLAGEGC